MVGAALADLTSIWLASHVGADEVQDEVHDALLRGHVDLIRRLLPISKMEIAERRPTSSPKAGEKTNRSDT